MDLVINGFGIAVVFWAGSKKQKMLFKKLEGQSLLQ